MSNYISCENKTISFWNFVKFGFSEKATKFEKNLRRTFDKSVVFYVKKSTMIFETDVVKSYYPNFIPPFEIWQPILA